MADQFKIKQKEEELRVLNLEIERIENSEKVTVSFTKIDGEPLTNVLLLEIYKI